MLDFGWLESLPPRPRWVLVILTLAIAALGTAIAGSLSQAIMIVLLCAVLWGVAYGRMARPALLAAAAQRAVTAEDHARDRGLLVARAMAAHERQGSGGLTALQAKDPGFSLPAFLAEAGRQASERVGPGTLVGPSAVEAVRFREVRTEVRVALAMHHAEGGSATYRLALSRPVHAVSPPPGEPLGWELDGMDPHPWSPDVQGAPVAGLSAARRALLARHEAFDDDAFASFVEEVNQALDRADAESAWNAYATPEGVACIRWWKAGPGLPPPTGAVEWLDVDEDGWVERIEVRTGHRVLGLQRPSGHPEAPWQLWRLRRCT